MVQIAYELDNKEKVIVKFLENNVEVVDCYKIKRKEDMKKIISFIFSYAKEQLNYVISCTEKDLYGELRFHIFVYSLGMFKKSTKNANLDYAGDPRPLVNFLSKIFSIF